jgi:hypothetical protein
MEHDVIMGKISGKRDRGRQLEKILMVWPIGWGKIQSRK